MFVFVQFGLKLLKNTWAQSVLCCLHPKDTIFFIYSVVIFSSLFQFLCVRFLIWWSLFFSSVRKLAALAIKLPMSNMMTQLNKSTLKQIQRDYFVCFGYCYWRYCCVFLSLLFSRSSLWKKGGLSTRLRVKLLTSA